MRDFSGPHAGSSLCVCDISTMLSMMGKRMFATVVICELFPEVEIPQNAIESGVGLKISCLLCRYLFSLFEGTISSGCWFIYLCILLLAQASNLQVRFSLPGAMALLVEHCPNDTALRKHCLNDKLNVSSMHPHVCQGLCAVFPSMLS